MFQPKWSNFSRSPSNGMGVLTAARWGSPNSGHAPMAPQSSHQSRHRTEASPRCNCLQKLVTCSGSNWFARSFMGPIGEEKFESWLNLEKSIQFACWRRVDAHRRIRFEGIFVHRRTNSHLLRFTPVWRDIATNSIVVVVLMLVGAFPTWEPRPALAL